MHVRELHVVSIRLAQVIGVFAVACVIVCAVISISHRIQPTSPEFTSISPTVFSLLFIAGPWFAACGLFAAARADRRTTTAQAQFAALGLNVLALFLYLIYLVAWPLMMLG